MQLSARQSVFIPECPLMNYKGLTKSYVLLKLLGDEVCMTGVRT